MVDKTPFQLSLDEKKQVWDYSNARYLAAFSALVSYGQLAVRSAFLLNGGILFALPTFIIAVRSGSVQTDPANLIVPSALFATGVLFAALTCLSAYYNFQYNLFGIESERLREFSSIEEGYDLDSVHRLKKSRKDYRASLDKDISNFESVVKWTVRTGIGFALASYLCFFGGCYFTAIAMLG
jgi:hypothetical protein